MDPISIGLGVVGLGMSIFGGLGSASASKQQAQVSAGIAQDEQQINAQKMQQAQMEARRMQLENARNAQRARASATSAAASQGAQYGSGLAGGLAQITDQEFGNAQGINQNLQFANNIFGINNDISGKKQQLAYLGGQQATDQGIASLGGALIKAGPTIGAFGKDAMGGLGKMNFNSLFGGGSPTGYGA